MRRLTLLLTVLAAAGAMAQVPQLLSYQGKLLDGTGAPVADGPYGFLRPSMMSRYWQKLQRRLQR